MKVTKLLLCAVMTTSAPLLAQHIDCPRPNVDRQLVFPDHSIAMRTALAVNPDGADASYTPGDHGYTYIANGVNLIERGQKVPCSVPANTAHCRSEWARAETGRFEAGTPEFCAFAIDVEPIAPTTQRATCEGKTDRFIVGNGRGRPMMGSPVSAAAGGSVTPYQSTTYLQHTVGGHATYVDSAAIPSLVAPTSRPELVGAIAWVRYGTRSTFAIVADTGPSFGEGSVALHQLLRSGSVGPTQPVGPLPTQLRCTPAEIGLAPPFASRPDIPGDDCNSGHPPRGATDIRAYGDIGDGVDSIILATVMLPMNDHTVTQELTTHVMEEAAAAAGFTPARLATMADCLNH